MALARRDVDHVDALERSRKPCDYAFVIIAETSTTIICVTDPPTHGGAHHVYTIESKIDGTRLAEIRFQTGPVGETGVNGLQHEDLLLVVQHRLDCFQAGAFRSGVNESTAGFVAGAIACEGTRTRRRLLASVEGTSGLANGVER